MQQAVWHERAGEIIVKTLKSSIRSASKLSNYYSSTVALTLPRAAGGDLRTLRTLNLAYLLSDMRWEIGG